MDCSTLGFPVLHQLPELAQTHLTSQVPLQYCSLRHWTLPSPPVTSTTEPCFHVGPASSFFLKLFPTSILGTFQPGGSSGVPSFCLFIQFTGFSRQQYRSGLPSLLQWTMFCQNSPPWPVRVGWPYTAWLRASLS